MHNGMNIHDRLTMDNHETYKSSTTIPHFAYTHKKYLKNLPYCLKVNLTTFHIISGSFVTFLQFALMLQLFHYFTKPRY